MRPSRLAVSGLGPFAAEVEVDLDALARDGLYLIHGPTGAGKTSLLDAMCFALYGQVPGPRERDGLRSQHAAPTTESWAELEFVVDGQRYLARRTPPYERPRKRGAGTTTQQATAHLAKAEGDEWKPVATGTDEVNRAVRELIGLDASQFSQVILLPQGRFEQVLQAGSGEREALLATLFSTDLFATVERWLDDRARAAAKDVEAVDRALVELRDRAAERLTEVAAEPVAPPADQVGLDALAGRAEEQAVTARRAAMSAADRHRRTAAERDTVAAVAARWDRRRTLLDERDALLAARDGVERTRDRLAAAERAAAVVPGLERSDRATRRAERATADLASALRDLLGGLRGLPDGTLGSAPGHEEALRSLDLVAGPEPVAAPLLETLRDDLRDRRVELRSSAELARRRDQWAREGADARARAERATTAAADAARAAAAADEAVLADRATLEAAREAAGRLDGLRTERDRLAERAEAAVALTAARGAATAAEDAVRVAVDAHQAAVDRHQDAQAVRLSQMAGVLAAGLDHGDACPVCGSEDHPHPAPLADDAVDDEALERLATAAEAAVSARRRAEEQVAQAREALAVLVERAGPDPDPAALAARLDEVIGDLDAAATAAARVEDLVARLERLTHAAAAHRTQQGEHERTAAEAEATARAADERVATAEAELAVSLGGSSVDVAAMTAAVEALAEATDRALTADRAAREAAAALTEAAEGLAADLDRAGFDAVDDVRAAALDPEALRALAADIRTHDERSAAVTTRLAEPDLSDLPDERPATAHLDEAVTEAERLRDATVATAEAWSTAATAIAEWSAEHRDLAADSVDLRDRAARLRRVAATVCGQTGTRVSLSRWVLAAYLEDICTLANQRLDGMTGGRYRLRVLPEGGHANRRGGLDLRVLDAHTGDERTVSTLSGGEAFQASLALALAVADAVQHHAGGLRMEALFIDEGFGSLDADALELAMDTLDQLRAGGRSVGVISHVASMRERIRTGVEVIPSEDGSTVRVGAVTA